MRRVFALLGASGVLAADPEGHVITRSGPVGDVIKLLEGIKKQIQEDTAKDAAIMADMKTYCTDTKAKKQAAVSSANERETSLKADIQTSSGGKSAAGEELEAKRAELADTMKTLADLEAAMAKRAEESHKQTGDLKQAIQQLDGALHVLGKVHDDTKADLADRESKEFIHGNSKGADNFGATLLFQQQAFAAVKSILTQTGAEFPELLDSGDRRMVMSMLSSGGDYHVASGEIYGILQNMSDQMKEDLAKLDKDIQDTLKLDNDTRQAKLDSKDTLETEIADEEAKFGDNASKLAQAKRDLKDTKAQLAADNEFLAELSERCAGNGEEHANRSASRVDELKAIEDTIRVLSSGSIKGGGSFYVLNIAPTSFLQVTTSKLSSTARVEAASLLRKQAMKSGNYALSQMAQATGLDAFEQIKPKIQKLIDDLVKQQADDVARHDACNADMEFMRKEMARLDYEQKDTAQARGVKENESKALQTLLNELAQNKKEAFVALDAATKERTESNAQFQQDAQDEKDMQKALYVALARMEKFYDVEAYEAKADMLFLQKRKAEPAPGNPMDLKKGGYSKNSGGAAVISLLKQINKDSEKNSASLLQTEQENQVAYEKFTADTNALVASLDEQTANKSEEKATVDEEVAALKAHGAALSKEWESFQDKKNAKTAECHQLLSRFDSIQQKRQEDIMALKDALNVLAGALQDNTGVLTQDT